MKTDNFCFYLQNRLIQANQTGGKLYSDTSPFSIPCRRVYSRRVYYRGQGCKFRKRKYALMERKKCFLDLNRFDQKSQSSTAIRETLSKGRRLSTVDLLVLTGLDHLLLLMKIVSRFYYKIRYLNEEVNRIELPFG